MQYPSHKGLAKGALIRATLDIASMGSGGSRVWISTGTAKTATIHESPMFHMRRDTGAVQF